MTGTAGVEMAKRNDVSVKMDAQVVEECRLASVFAGVSLAEYISEVCRVAATKDIKEGIAKRQAKEGKGGAK